MSKRKLKIFIAEEIWARNKGEAAILWGMIESFKLLGQTTVYICSYEPEIDAAEYGEEIQLIHDNYIEAGNMFVKLLNFMWIILRHCLFLFLYPLLRNNTTRFMRSPLWKTYIDADIIVIGHDNTLVGHGSYTSLIIPYIAKVLNKPVVIYAGTVGPFMDPITPLVTKHILNSVQLITLREYTSLETIKTLGVNNVATYVTADAAFLMPPASPECVKEILEIENIKNDRPLIGITITQDMAYRYGFRHYNDLQDGYQAYIQMFARLVDIMIEEFNAFVIALTYSTGPEKRQDDRIPNQEVYSQVNEKEKFRIITNNYSAKELKGVTGKCELLIGNRTHSMIAATSMGVPTIAISSRMTGSKTRGIIGYMLKQQEWILDIETLSSEKLIQLVEKAWLQRELIRTDLQNRIPEIQSSVLQTGVLIRDLLSDWYGPIFSK